MSETDNHGPPSSSKKRRNSFWRRTRMVSFRVSDEEYERLKLQSQAGGARSVSEFARLALVRPAPAPHGREPDAPVEQLRARVEQLGAQVSDLWNVLERARVENSWTRTELFAADGRGRDKVLRQTIVIAFVIGVGSTLAATGWRACGPYGATCSDAGQYFPMHEAATNLFSGVVYDLSGNGIVETFVSMGAAGITDIEVDADEDGRIDRRLQLNTDGTLRQVAGPPSVSATD